MGAAMLKRHQFVRSLWASYGVPFGNRWSKCVPGGVRRGPCSLRRLITPFATSQRKFNVSTHLGFARNMATNTPQIKEQNFDYFLVLDFEATCDDKTKIQPQVSCIV